MQADRDADSREALIRHLEAVSQRRLRTPADVAAYLEEVRERDDAPPRRWQHAKTLFLLALAGFAVLQYVMLDAIVQIAYLPHLTVFVPISTLL